MASLSPWLAPWLRPARQSICPQCRRAFTTSPRLASGHNRWSKIRHEKGAADKKKTAVRSNFTKVLTLYSKLYGPNPDLNPQLATAITAAKKAAVPKATIENAIARGQGRSQDGKTLESVTIEAILPPSVAVIIETETDNRLRTLQDINLLIKQAKGNRTPAQYLFERVGRVVFERKDNDADGAEAVGPDEILDDAIEAGAEDVHADEDGNIVVWTSPKGTNQVVQGVAAKFGLNTLSAEAIWSPIEDTVARLGTTYETKKLINLLAALEEHPEVQAVYTNAVQGDATDEEWQKVEGLLAST